MASKKEIIYSEHANERVKGRKISKKRIEKTIEAPEAVQDSFRGRKLRRRKFGSKILEVVTKTEDSKTTVVTVYYLKEE